MAWAWDGASLDVQMGFGYAPATPIASITWTSIVGWVRDLSFGLGKSDELDSYQAGRLSMTLDNRDRRFDPLHATGPYFGNLKPMVPVRVRFTYGGTTVTSWSGFASGFPQAYDPPNDATVTVTASDGFAVLQRTKMPSAYAVEVLSDDPTLWWRLGEQEGIVAVDSSGNGHDGLYSGGATFNTRTGLVVDSDNAIKFSGIGSNAVGSFTLPTPPLSVEFWFQYTTGGLHNQSICSFGNNQSDYMVVRLSGTDQVTAAYNQSTGTLLYAVSTPGYGGGATHHCVVVFPSATATPIIYVDGAAVALTSGSHAGTATSLGNGPFVLNDDVSLNPASSWDREIVLDEVAVYPSALSPTRVASHYFGGVVPFVGIDTGAAISYVLDAIGWPAADRTIEAGKSTVVSFDMGGKTALGVIQDMEKTEQGRFFIAPDGKATFYNRHHTLITAASNTSQATFGDGAGAELPYGDLNLENSEDKIRNSITTQRVGGSPFTVRDAASITSYREREYSVTGLYNSSAAETRDLGLWVLGHYAQPATRVPEIVVQPRGSPSSLYPQIRDRKPCDRVTVKRRPQGVGSAISLDVLIEGVEHRVTVDDWATKLLLSPAEVTGFFILDDATFGKLGLNALAF